MYIINVAFHMTTEVGAVLTIWAGYNSHPCVTIEVP